MVCSKAPSKKQQGRGVDFKKIKRKVGRKLPPPKNATNTEIKSKAIILPEQSVASDKAGLAVSKKGLTLKELLQQTSHHNVKVRKAVLFDDALLGIRELLLKHPTELKLHKLAIVEKLRERISDDDKVVRETLYQLFKSVVLPGCKEDNRGALLSLLMAYIFNAMTHLSIDVRLMAFKFFDLVVQHYPPAFSSYAEKILDNYMDILKKNQFHMEEKSKLKIALSGLVRCLSLLASNEKEGHSSGQSNADKQVLFAFEPDVPKDHTGHILIIGKLNYLVAVLINCFEGLVLAVHSQPLLDSQSFDCMLTILQSIDLVVQYYLYGINKYQQDLHSSIPTLASLDISVQDQKFPPLLLDKLFAVFPMQPIHHLSEKDDQRYFILNAVISQIFFTFCQWICPSPVLLDGFLKFLVDVLSKLYGGELSNKSFYEKHLLSLVPFIPKLLSILEWSWKGPLLQAFTMAFGRCYPDSAMKMACLQAVEEMLLSMQHILYLDSGDKELLEYQRIWISEIPLLLSSLGNRHPSCSHRVLYLQCRLGQIGLSNTELAEEYDKIQDELHKFYCICTENGEICYGPFMELPKDSQEICICCLYYFSSLRPHLLASLAFCCLSHSLEPSILFRIIEVLHSSYKAGHIQNADYISFFITLVSQYEVIPEKTDSSMEKEAKASNQVTFRSVTGVICSFLPQMGDQFLVFQILEEVVLDLTSQKLPMDNTCALMRMLVTVDSRPTGLSEKSITELSHILLSYLIDVAMLFPEDIEESTTSANIYASRYYLLPCFVLLDRSTTLLKRLLDKMGLAVDSCELPFLRDSHIEKNDVKKIKILVSIFSMIHEDAKLQQLLSSCKVEIDNILQRTLSLQLALVGGDMSIEEQQQQINSAVEKLKVVINEISGTGS